MELEKVGCVEPVLDGVVTFPVVPDHLSTGVVVFQCHDQLEMVLTTEKYQFLVSKIKLN